MSSDQLFAIKVAMHVVSLVVAVIAAVLALLAAAADSKRNETRRQRFNEIAKALESAPITQLPQTIINWLIARRYVFEAISKWGTHSWSGAIIMGGTAGFAWWLLPDTVPHRFVPVMAKIAVLLLLVTYVLDWKHWFPRLARGLEVLWRTLLLLVAIAFGWMVIETLRHSSSFSTHLSAALVAFGLSLVLADNTRGVLDSGHFCLRGSYFTAPETDIQIGAIAIAAGTSVLITLMGYWTGRLAEPNTFLLPLPQLVLSNLVFDSATVSFTLWVFQQYRLSIAIILEIFVSALFACASLWFGLVGTSVELSIQQVCSVLYGRSIDGDGLSIGPHFWIMHTTFVPTVIYSVIIAVAGVAKLIAIAVAKFVKQGAKPHISPIQYIGLTAAVFLALFQGIAQLAGDFEEKARIHEDAINKTPSFQHDAPVDQRLSW